MRSVRTAVRYGGMDHRTQSCKTCPKHSRRRCFSDGAQSKGQYVCLLGVNRVCGPRWLRVGYLTHVLVPVLSYLDKTHITALEYPTTLSIIIDLRHTRTDTDEIRRIPGDKRRVTHLVPVSQSDKYPSRDVLETKNGISAAVCAVSGYETSRIFTLQFQKSIESSTTTITVCQGRGVNVNLVPFRCSIAPFLGMRLRFGTH